MPLQSVPPRAADAGADAGTAPSADAPADPHLRKIFAEEQAIEERESTRLLIQRQRFDLANERHAELLRELGAIRDLFMAQLKDEDAYLKKWIEMI